MNVTATNRLTGEIYEFPATTREDVIKSWAEIEAALGAYKQLKSHILNRGFVLLEQTMKDASNES